MRDETRRGHADRDGCAVSVLVTFSCVFFSSDFCVFLSFVFCGEKLMRLQELSRFQNFAVAEGAPRTT